MDFDYSTEELAFRDEVRHFLDENLPAPEQRDAQFRQQWLKKIREKRWVGFSWPKAVGGGGGSIMEQVILKAEMAARQAPALGTSFMGLAWVGPGIIEYGSEAQKARFIPPILASQVQWCTGYSEPGVGSDLAALQCRATREDDFYIVNGQKIWTTFGPFADWIMMLVRTDARSEVKHEGITCLLVEMNSPGIEVRPIENMAGGKVFSEIFFDDVKVPIAQRLGEEGKGWEVTISSLANERSSIGDVNAMLERLNELKVLLKKEKQGDEILMTQPVVRQQLAYFEAKIEAMRLNGLRYLTKQIKGEPLSSETSVNKLHRASLEVEINDFAMACLGARGLYKEQTPGVIDAGTWLEGSLNWPNVVIGGGTPNIQKNIIAERILGLPKD